MTLYVQIAVPKLRSPSFPEMIDQFIAATVIRTTGSLYRLSKFFIPIG